MMLPSDAKVEIIPLTCAPSGMSGTARKPTVALVGAASMGRRSTGRITYESSTVDCKNNLLLDVLIKMK